MYTGIVQAQLPIMSIVKKEGLTCFSLDFPDCLLVGLAGGASISVNGVCFTVTTINGSSISFDAIRESLALSNIKYLEVGSMVNIERSARQDAEVGGHILSGHVMNTATVSHIESSENNCRMTLTGHHSWLKYVFDKGFLAVNGASLTVAKLDREANTFCINLIPETLKRTNFSLLKPGDEVNIEVESQTQVIVDTVERVLAERYPQNCG
jgi:riboflavin synthase